MPLKEKTILIISPQAWGQMFISKHHYAITLAKMGNRVYFLNPPETISSRKAGQIDIHTSLTHYNLLLIEHTLKFPFLLKFHALPLFHLLMGYHIKRILKKIGRQVDIVWSFDQGHLYPFKLFGDKPFKIFQPVDEPLNQEAIDAAEGSQVILSVTPEILQKYAGFKQPRHLINHGIGEEFLQTHSVHNNKASVHVGLSGNLLREDVDRETLVKIIDQNPGVVFEYWGPYSLLNNNIGGSDTAATRAFIKILKEKGVVMHGPGKPGKLAAALQEMDAFLICYDVKKDQSRGTNYHKIMEYLSTGKVIIANNVTFYHNKPHLVNMITCRDDNRALPALFKITIENLPFYNSASLMQQRIAYAHMNTYTNHVRRIERIIGSLNAKPSTKKHVNQTA